MIKKNNFCFKNRLHLIDTEFPGCTFLPFEAKNMIKKNLNKLNNSVFNSELNGTTLYINNENLCFGIMFNEGEIIKNCLYKKMEITDTIMFIPIEIYNLNIEKVHIVHSHLRILHIYQLFLSRKFYSY